MPSGLFKLLRAGASRPSELEAQNTPNYRRRGVTSEERKLARRQIVVSPPRLESLGPEVVAGPRLAPALSWACQYQGIKVDAIAKCPADAVVIDATPDGSRENFFSSSDTAAMRSGQGRPKKLIAYMSIGEAEYCRFYWKDAWVRNGQKTAEAPKWLDQPNQDNWEGNWTVRYWDPTWQDIIINRPDSFLNRIIDAGFDGVFLDIIDAFEYWMNTDRGTARRPTADGEMVAFVRRIAEHARVTRGKKDFAVVPINGEPLLKYPEFRAAISAIGKEHIFFEQVGKAKPTPHIRQKTDVEVEEVVSLLRLAIADRIPVLAMEYLLDWTEDHLKIAATTARMRSCGFVPHYCKCDLASLSPVTLLDGGAVA
jgi:cysteinyl-tRNA synthetase, unknown class